jgi:hypothetical protein
MLLILLHPTNNSCIRGDFGIFDLFNNIFGVELELADLELFFSLDDCVMDFLGPPFLAFLF